MAFLEVWWFVGSLVGFIFGGIFEKFVFFWEKVVPSILNDPTMILLYFGAPRPPGKFQNEGKNVRKLDFFLEVKNTSRNDAFIFFGDFRGPAWVPGGSISSVF